MKTLLHLTIITFSFLFFSCSQKKEIVESSYPNGSPKVVGVYKDELKIAEIKYYENGKKELEGFYNEKLERNGKWIYWFENGKIWSECEYKNGIKEGKSTVFFENGQKRYEGNYKNDSTIGVWKFWNEKGELVKEINYGYQ